MRCYISFPDDAVFGSVALPDESLTTQLGITVLESAQPVYMDSPVEEAAVKVTREEAAPIVRPTEGSSTFWTPNEESPRWEHSPNQFPGWKEVLHPSRPVITTGQIPPISQGSKQRPHSKTSRERMAQCQRADEQLKTQAQSLSPHYQQGC